MTITLGRHQESAMPTFTLYKGYQLQYNVEMLLLLWILWASMHAVVDYLFTSIVTYCAFFMLTFIILLLQITDTLDKTL